jgi:AcrR family transcriptional regulator
MSKSTANTQEKILDKALEMFNERGIEYVGLRELAATLGIRVSNITYYFPTKDDLVYQLSLQLSKTNAAVIIEKESLTMLGFLQMMHQVFQNQVRFRCLLLSVVHLMKQNKHLAVGYKKTQQARNATLHSNLITLVEAGYLKVIEASDRDCLVSGISLISRFWISEAAISFSKKNNEEHQRHYLLLVTKLFVPYATAKAKKEIRIFINGLP